MNQNHVDDITLKPVFPRPLLFDRDSLAGVGYGLPRGHNFRKTTLTHQFL